MFEPVQGKPEKQMIYLEGLKYSTSCSLIKVHRLHKTVCLTLHVNQSKG